MIILLITRTYRLQKVYRENEVRFTLCFVNIFSSKDAGLRIAMNNSKMIKSDSGLDQYDEYAENGHHIKQLHVYIFGRLCGLRNH